MYFILLFPFQSPGNGCFHIPHSLESLNDVERNVVQTTVTFSRFSYIEVEQVLFVRQECFSLLTFVHSANVPEKNISSKPCTKQNGWAGLKCRLTLFFGPCGLLAAQRGECSCLMWVAFAMDVSLWWVFSSSACFTEEATEGNTKLVWTGSEAATLMETLPYYQLRSHLLSCERFFWSLSLVNRRYRANELSFLPSDPSNWA